MPKPGFASAAPSKHRRGPARRSVRLAFDLMRQQRAFAKLMKANDKHTSPASDADDVGESYYTWCKTHEVSSDVAWPFVILSVLSALLSGISWLSQLTSSTSTCVSHATISSLISSEFSRKLHGISNADGTKPPSAARGLNLQIPVDQISRPMISDMQPMGFSRLRQINLKKLAPTDFAVVENCLEDTLSRASNAEDCPTLTFSGQHGIYTLTFDEWFITVPALQRNTPWQDINVDEPGASFTESSYRVSLCSKFPTDHGEIEAALASLAPGWSSPMILTIAGLHNYYSLTLSGLSIALGRDSARQKSAGSLEKLASPMDTASPNTAKRNEPQIPEASDARASNTGRREAKGKRPPRKEGESRFAEFFRSEYQPPGQSKPARPEVTAMQSRDRKQDSPILNGDPVHPVTPAPVPRGRASTLGNSWPTVDEAGKTLPIERYFYDRDMAESPGLMAPGESQFQDYQPEVWAPALGDEQPFHHPADAPSCQPSPQVLHADQTEAAFTSQPAWPTRKPDPAASDPEDPFQGPTTARPGPSAPRSALGADLKVLNSAFQENLRDASTRAAAGAPVSCERAPLAVRPVWIRGGDDAPTPTGAAAGDGSPGGRRRGYRWQGVPTPSDRQARFVTRWEQGLEQRQVFHPGELRR